MLFPLKISDQILQYAFDFKACTLKEYITWIILKEQVLSGDPNDIMNIIIMCMCSSVWKHLLNKTCTIPYVLKKYKAFASEIFI